MENDLSFLLIEKQFFERLSHRLNSNEFSIHTAQGRDHGVDFFLITYFNSNTARGCGHGCPYLKLLLQSIGRSIRCNDFDKSGFARTQFIERACVSQSSTLQNRDAVAKHFDIREDV